MSKRRRTSARQQIIEAIEPRRLLTGAADVTYADLLVKNIAAANNTYSYNLPPTVTLNGVNGGTAYNNSSDCSTFIESLLETSYSITSSQFSSWTGSTWPQASDLYTAALDDVGFTGFMQIGDVQPGDMMFIKYSPTTTDTGHCVMFDQLPTLVSSTATQRAYNAVIVDCTGDVHTNDSRYETGPDGTNETGVGRGTIRLYTDQYGNLTSYSWGTSNASIIEGPNDPSGDTTQGDRSPIFAKAPVSSAVTGNAWLSAGSQATWTTNTSGNTLTVTGPATIVADTGTDSPNIVLSGSAAQLIMMPGTTSTVHVNSLTLTNGATATVYDPNSGSIVLDIAANVNNVSPGPGMVSVDNTSKLDLQDNDMLVHNGSLSTITAEVKSGFNAAGGGKWNGNGITSSAASADSTHLSALGVILNTNGTTALYPTFDGKTSTTTDVLVKYTYFGDATLDGKVDASDYSRIDNSVLHPTTSTGWYNGDLNYDGIINGSDYTLMDNAFNTQGKQVVFSPSAIVDSTVKTTAPTPAPAVSPADSSTDPFKKSKTRKPLILSLNL